MSDSSRMVTVLGGYGIFGGRIAEALARDGTCRVRVVGRSARIGQNFAHRIGADFYPSMLEDRQALARAIAGPRPLAQTEIFLTRIALEIVLDALIPPAKVITLSRAVGRRRTPFALDPIVPPAMQTREGDGQTQLLRRHDQLAGALLQNVIG